VGTRRYAIPIRSNYVRTLLRVRITCAAFTLRSASSYAQEKEIRGGRKGAKELTMKKDFGISVIEKGSEEDYEWRHILPNTHTRAFYPVIGAGAFDAKKRYPTLPTSLPSRATTLLLPLLLSLCVAFN
jgi:hypothetical protein